MSTEIHPEAAGAGQAASPAAGEAKATAAPAVTAPRQAAAAAKPVAAPVGAKPSGRRPVGPVRRFFRLVISHTIVALLAVVAALGYLYHRDILGRMGDELCTESRLGGYMTKSLRPAALNTPEKRAEAPATGVEQHVAPVAADEGRGAVASPHVSLAAAPPAPAVAPVAELPPPPKAVPPAPKADETAVAHVSSSHGESAEATSAGSMLPASQVPVHGPSGSVAADTPPVAPSRTEIAAAEAPAPDKPAADALMREWQAARQAFAEHRAEAVDVYRKLIERHPEVAELRGELGNVLYAAGRKGEAAEQYYEAALQQLKGPMPGLAACLADVIEPLDKGRADALRARVQQPCPFHK